MPHPFVEAKILIIDDEPDRIKLLRELLTLSGFSNIRGESDSRQAWSAFEELKPDLVILDLHMAHFSGFDVLRQLKPLIDEHEYLPILVLTGDATRQAKEQALAAGAMDFIAKPFNANEILLRIKNLLHTRKLHLELEQQKRQLEQRVKERTAELDRAYREVLERLAVAAEYRDDETGQHTKRVGDMARRIALALGVPDEQADLIGQAALLHDLGKIGISDLILRKEGKLSDAEMAEMRTHTTIGANILSGSQSSLLQIAEAIALTHHERWDGSGYAGLSGESIPLVGRITAVADVFDALTNERPYKEAWPEARAIEEITSQSGKSFDPQVVEAFLKVIAKPEETRVAVLS